MIALSVQLARTYSHLIDLDHNASTRPTSEVVAAVAGALRDAWHNPSSVHRGGQAARQVVELARRDLADLIGARPRDLTLTSGGTEAIHLAIRGVLGATGRGPTGAIAKGPPIVVSTLTEHAAVRDLIQSMADGGGAHARWAPVDRHGVVDLTALAPLLDGAAVASIQWANNETGAIQPVEAIARLCRDRRVPFHCDGTQWVGKEPVLARPDPTRAGSAGPGPAPPGPTGQPSPPGPPCDLLTFSPHKFHGPKGVGVLWTRPGTRVAPIFPGSQELGRRGGTENVPGIAGAGVAARQAAAWLADPAARARQGLLRDRFEQRVTGTLAGAVINGPVSHRLWNTTNIAFPGLEAEAILMMLSERGVYASAGAACSSGSLDPSPVLLAMGVPGALAHGSVRFSLSRDTTEAEINAAAEIVIEVVRSLAASTAAALPGRPGGTVPASP